jgi:hypothetical protein
MPPTAQEMGSAAFLKDASSPTISSRLISKPTKRKNIAISPSSIHWCNVSDSEWPAIPIVNRTCHKRSYAFANGELASKSATTPNTTNTDAPAASVLKKR